MPIRYSAESISEGLGGANARHLVTGLIPSTHLLASAARRGCLLLRNRGENRAEVVRQPYMDWGSGPSRRSAGRSSRNGLGWQVPGPTPKARTRQTQDSDMPQGTIRDSHALTRRTSRPTRVSLKWKKSPTVMNFLKLVIYIKKIRKGHVRMS